MGFIFIADYKTHRHRNDRKEEALKSGGGSTRHSSKEWVTVGDTHQPQDRRRGKECQARGFAVGSRERRGPGRTAGFQWAS